MIAVCIIGLLFTIISSLVIYLMSKRQKNFIKSCAMAVVAMVILSVGLEATLFNINYYTTAKNTPVDLSEQMKDSLNENGSYSIDGITGIEFKDINTKIKNIKIDLTQNNSHKVPLRLQLTDEANQFYYTTPQKEIYPSVEKSEYINIHTSGESKKILIKFDNEDAIEINSVTINTQRPFEFSLVRVLIVMGILILLYIFRPSSPIYKHKYSEAKNLRYNLTVAFLALECIILVFVGTMNPSFLGFDITDDGIVFSELAYKHHNQYDELAQAILQGKTYIDNNDVPQSLIDMDNPYDTTARYFTSSLTGDTYRWDVAYFEGHYYVYFGIVPLLLMYLPFRAIVDAPFPSAVGVIAFAFIFAIGVFKLLGIICEKKFKNVSVGTFLLTALATVNCCGVMFLVKRPDFYSVPIMTGLAFVVWGIFLWIKGLNTEKLRNLFFVAGSLCLALSVGCRPQLVLVCALALPIFAKYFFTEKKITTKKGLMNILVLAVPFVIVAAGIMYYNYIRFGSVTDFGSGYNLTTNDVTRRGFDFGRTGLGIFTYLFQTPQFTATFPYIKPVEIDTQYMGKTIYEFCFGGLITSLPVLWFTGALPKVYRTLRQKGVAGLVITLLTIGLALVIADTQAGGLLQRYYSDFGIIFFLAAAIIIFALFEKNNLNQSHINLNTLLFISTILSIVYTITLVFSVADVTIDTQNPTLYAEILHLVEFWI
ncbi:MAG: hypothetical protein E7530_02760 [Ruminococcaceae bacterium]|nr:hypothetical protein [Oscillospiraceae bacterium]